MAAKRSLDMQGRNLDLFRVTAASKLDTDGSEIGLTFSFPVPSGQEQQHVSSIKLKQDNENQAHVLVCQPCASRQRERRERRWGRWRARQG